MGKLNGIRTAFLSVIGEYENSFFFKYSTYIKTTKNFIKLEAKQMSVENIDKLCSKLCYIPKVHIFYCEY